jgi:hypothetical protein
MNPENTDNTETNIITQEQYNELYAEFEFNEADTNHNGIISRKEEINAHKNPKIGSLLKPIAGETIEQYKERVLDIINKYSKVTNTYNGKFEKIRKLLIRRSENLLGTRYNTEKEIIINDFYLPLKDIINE